MVYEEEKEIVLCYTPAKIDRNQVKPTEFLQWAKSDLNGGDKRSRGNALGNIKKAIHSRIDEIINSTHLVFASDWKWKTITTEVRLKILKDLGIGRGDIANVITKERNTYEHQYILPPLRTIRAYRDIAELWLNESYGKYNFSRIAIFGLPTYEVVAEGGTIKKIVLSNIYRGITYFWDRKKECHQTAKDKSFTVTKYGSLTWKDILSLEKVCIKGIKGKEIYNLSQSDITRIFNMYRQKATVGRCGFFNPGIHITI